MTRGSDARARLAAGLLAVLVATVLAAGVTLHHVSATVERRARDTLERQGVTARDVRFHWLGPLRLRDVVVSGPAGAGLTVERVDVGWRLLGGRDVRRHVRRVTLHGVRVERSPLGAVWPRARLDVVSWTREGGAERLKLRQPGADGGQLDIEWPPRDGEPVLTLSRLDLDAMSVSWKGEHVLRPGRWTGRLGLEQTAARLSSEGAFHGEAARLALPQAVDAESFEGEPTGMTLEWSVCRDERAVEVDRVAVRFDGLDLAARGTLRAPPESHVDLVLSARSELAEAFRTLGLPPPLPEARADRFGRLWLDLTVRGPMADADELKAVPRLRFEVTPEVDRALAYLRGPFRHRPDPSPGVVVDVREGAPGFVPLTAVPDVFRRALLLAEDPNFNSHAGIDVSAIVAAWSRNQEEGRIVSGGSTLTQQLVKNLMLSPERTYGRKLQEAALALMVDAAIPKTRLLEIYLNVIEWGPRLHGIGPAARHYFGRDPAQLSAKEMVFLIGLIPSPVKLHDAHLAGRPGPQLEQAMDRLLGRLYRAGVLSDDDYWYALYEPLQFAPEVTPVVAGRVPSR